MKKFCLILVIVFLLCGCSTGTYEDGYEEGYRSGYSTAEAELEYQIDEEWYDGYEFGYEEGYYEAEKEYESNYELGYDEGYYAGATYTCLYFGDVDRAFKSADNGCAWYAFVDSWDELVENIFDSDEERGEIVWSLISVMVSEDFTVEEAETLTETFGSELFIRNGINLHP